MNPISISNFLKYLPKEKEEEKGVTEWPMGYLEVKEHSRIPGADCFRGFSFGMGIPTECRGTQVLSPRRASGRVRIQVRWEWERRAGVSS